MPLAFLGGLEFQKPSGNCAEPDHGLGSDVKVIQLRVSAEDNQGLPQDQHAWWAARTHPLGLVPLVPSILASQPSVPQDLAPDISFTITFRKAYAPEKLNCLP